jgi:hypothetical protein
MKHLYKEGELVIDDFGISKVIEVDEDGTATAQRIMTKDMIVEMFHKFIITELDEDILQKFLNSRDMSIVTNDYLRDLHNKQPKQKIVYCKDCVHRDPEDKKCDCGGQERTGCIFRVRDNYFCAFGEKKGGES